MNINPTQGGIQPANFNPGNLGDLKELKNDLSNVQEGHMTADQLLAKYTNNPVESPKPQASGAAGGAEGGEETKEQGIMELLMKILEMIMGKDKPGETGEAGGAGGAESKPPAGGPGGAEGSGGGEDAGGIKDVMVQIIMQLFQQLLGGLGNKG